MQLVRYSCPKAVVPMSEIDSVREVLHRAVEPDLVPSPAEGSLARSGSHASAAAGGPAAEA